MNYTDPDSVPPIWEIGDIILDKYEVCQVFSGGGMGLVYRVYHRNWDIELAVKTPRTEFFETAEQISNFENEAETWVNLGVHPQIASCHYVRRLGGIPRIFAEFVGAGSLAEWIKTGKIYQKSQHDNLRTILDIAIQFAWGLRYAHQKGVVHLDVKPGNALMTPDGILKVCDFGLAKAKSNSAIVRSAGLHFGQSIYVDGSGYMTPEYASPEQSRGDSLTEKTDIWSWAVSVLEMMKGGVDWAHGYAAPYVLEEFYKESFEDDPLARVLSECLTIDSASRPTAKSICKELEDIYNSFSDSKLSKKYTDDDFLNSDSFNNRAVSLLDLGREDDAFAEFDKSLKVNPTNINANYNLLLAKWRLRRIGDEDIIRELWRKRNESNSIVVDALLSCINVERGVANSKAESAGHSSESEILSAGLSEIVRHKHPIAFVRARQAKDGSEALTVTQAGLVCISNNDGGLLYSTQIRAKIWECELTTDWRTLIFTTRDNGGSYIHTFNLDSERVEKSVHAHSGMLYCLRIIDPTTLFTSGEDKALNFWDIESLGIVDRINLSDADLATESENGYPFGRRDVSPYDAIMLSNRRILATMHSGHIRFWSRNVSAASNEPAWTTSGVLSSVFPSGRLVLSPNKRYFAFGGHSPSVVTASGEHIHTFQTGGRYVADICFSESSELLFGCGRNGGATFEEYRSAVMVWSVESSRLIRTIPLGDNGQTPDLISEVGEGKSIFIGQRNGSVNYFTQCHSENAPYAISRPKGIIETNLSQLVLERAISDANSAMLNGDYDAAVVTLHSLQADAEQLLHPEVRALEEGINAVGWKVTVLSACLEPYVHAASDQYYTFINTEGTQLLLAKSVDRSPSKLCFREAILFDIPNSTALTAGTLSDCLWDHGGTGVWNLGSYLGDCFYGEVIYVNCDLKISRSLPLNRRSKTSIPHTTLDGRFMLITSSDSNVLWNPLNGKVLGKMRYFDEHITTCGCLNRRGTEAVLFTGPNELTKYSLPKWKSVVKYGNRLHCDRRNRERYLAISDKFNKLLLATHFGIDILSYQNGELLEQISVTGVTCITSCLDSSIVFVGYQTGKISAIDISHSYCEDEIAFINEPVTSLNISKDGNRLIVNRMFVFHLIWSFNFIR